MASLHMHLPLQVRVPLMRAVIGSSSQWSCSNRMQRMRLLQRPQLPNHPPHARVRLFSSPRALADEEAAAKAAATIADTGAPTIFDKIIRKEIPATIVYEDEKVLAFRDINPQAPVHILLIPKKRDGLTQLSKAEPRHADILGYMLYSAKVVAEKEGISEGYRIVINNGPGGCQSVYHIHLHILGGRQMKWPAG
ncbi:14 kDa zinc-binding protein isoform X2 [Cryptomeria japonica]|uniref:14 kDa zinc-binding protein isoform X2 n=1 Tax=Cryptomeria japonica TaxID=3369 RepID=UPI0027DA9634|nr:14 kDa zinc-binding protein isoform X2 [Cryptomeria japonica]